MIIDLSDIPLRVTETDKELYLLKSAKMWSEIKNMKKKHNFIIMPILRLVIFVVMSVTLI